MKSEFAIILFIKIIFWAGVFANSIRLIDMSLSEWPKTREISLGEKVAETIIGIGMTIWAGIILFT